MGVGTAQADRRQTRRCDGKRQSPVGLVGPPGLVIAAGALLRNQTRLQQGAERPLQSAALCLQGSRQRENQAIVARRRGSQDNKLCIGKG